MFRKLRDTQQLVSLMANYVGLDPNRDINWVSHPMADPKDLFVKRQIDAFLASAPEGQDSGTGKSDII